MKRSRAIAFMLGLAIGMWTRWFIVPAWLASLVACYFVTKRFAL